MKAIRTMKLCLLLGALLCVSPTLKAASGSDLLQQALYAEEVEGNVNSAIRLYGQVVTERSATRSQVAQALYRQGMCYMKIKDEPAARTALQKLVTDYSDQTELVEKAKSVLEDLTNYDPATLMPPNTLLYVEMGSPGRQIETIVNMLKGTPYENPLAVMGNRPPGNNRPNSQNVGGILSALLNPSMLAEFKKIRSQAIGVSDFTKNGEPVFVEVIYPGKSDALRGILLAALGVAGTASDPIEGMQTLTIQGKVAAAYDDKVIIVTQPPQQLAWSVKQYKGTISEPTLATRNAAFSAVSKKQRQEQALTVWANVSGIYAKALQLIPPDDLPDGLAAANAIVDFRNIDSLILSAGIEPDGLTGKMNLLFKEGHRSLAYDLIRTPNIRKAAFGAVPVQAIGLASFALSQSESAQAQTLRGGIQNVTGLDVGREVFANIEQVTVFALPADKNAADNSKFLPGQFGLALTSRDPARTKELLVKLLGTANLVSGGGATNVPGRFKVGVNGKTDVYCYVEQAEGMTVLSLNHAIVDASLSAIRNHKSALTAGPLSKTINKLDSTASKLLLVNAGGMIRLVSQYMNTGGATPEQAKQLTDALEQLARAAEGTSLELRTDEQINSLSTAGCLGGMPPINELVGPAMQVSKAMEQIKATAVARAQGRETPALILPAASAPVIDGNVDELWNSCRSYTLDNVLKPAPDSTNAFGASYRTTWDKYNLYLLVEVKDSTLRHDPALRWWYNDSLEIYIDASNRKQPAYTEKEVQYAFNWDKTAPSLNELKHSRTNGVRFAQATADKGYRLEMAIPWTALGATPAPGLKIGLDVQANDNRGGSERDAKISWYDRQDRAYTAPQAFGTAELGGLVGWWKFDETQGTAVADSSEGHHNGTVVGTAAWKPGKHGGAIDLNGRSHVRITDKKSFDMTDQVTIACWVNMRSVPALWTAIVTKGDSSWRISTESQEKRFHFAVDNNYEGGPRVSAAREVGVNEWHHVVAVFTGDVMRLYVDGKLETSQTKKGKVGRNDAEVWIGENAERTGRGFDGLIDDLRVYNYALPESKVMGLAAGE